MRSMLVVLGCVAASAGASAAELLAVPLLPSGAVYSDASGINSAGTIVGSAYDANFASTPYLFSGGQYTLLGLPVNATQAYATDVSDTGIVVGGYTQAGTGQAVNFLWQNGQYTDFSIAGLNNAFIQGISGNGRFLTGYVSTGVGVNTDGFVYDRDTGTYQVLHINADGQTRFAGVTNAGIAVGSSGFSNNRISYVYDGVSGAVLQSTPPGAAITLRDIDESGTYYGYRYSPQAGQGVGLYGTDLQNLSTFTAFGAPITFIYGGSNGQVVGRADLLDGSIVGFLATPVPEPATWMMVVMGAGLLAWRGRARRKAD